MGSFDYRDGISIIQIIVFPIFLWVGLKFKMEQKPGWFGISFLSLCRIVGGSCILALINRNSRGLWATVLSTSVIHKNYFLVPQILAYVDLGVSIAGFVMVGRRKDALAPTPYSRAGIALNTLIYLWMVGIFFAMWLRRSPVPKRDRPVLVCVAACVPCLAVRMVYALLYIIIANKLFNTVVGHPAIYMFMATLPEIAVVGICSWTILKLDPRKEGRKVEGAEGERDLPLVQSVSR
ncbi:hypothetical protein HYFRA_00011460 [Hymenoscyphus fraxineus]|uniref:DUF7702 domain-containing protein n=1 Tax=Hymenoscyphus fraxineus TaxID=746836 RepID=A0A9N9L0Z4_9HELO|nr:hypothetical protein HYFRA_00011460 [Hymenoscyphus fraxineus]